MLTNRSSSIIVLLTFPGVVIHQFTRQLLFRYLRIPIYKTCYFCLGNTAGYVMHGPIESWVHQILVKVGPFFLNVLLGTLISLPSVLRIEFNGSGTAIDIFLTWLGTSIVMHAIPSEKDAEFIWVTILKEEASIFIKIIIIPIIALILLLSLSSALGFNWLYGMLIISIMPKILVMVLA